MHCDVRGEFCERITESMPNGFYGSKERWEKMEAPFRQVDHRIEEFAKIHAMSIEKNYHNWPGRSLSWINGGITRLIQISLKDDPNETYCIWLCAWQDRGHDRFWKRHHLLERATWAEVEEELQTHLDQTHKIVQAWSASDMEFAGKISLP